jgi:hypothetical protein
VRSFDRHVTKIKYDFFDRLEDASLQITASGKPVGRWRLERFVRGVVEHVERQQPQQLRIPAHQY